MAVCRHCCEEMLNAAGCSVATTELGESTYRRKPYGKEWSGCRDRCSDCGALKGMYHHPGCDIELCPRCSGQAISCRCPEEAFDEDYYEESYGRSSVRGERVRDVDTDTDPFVSDLLTTHPGDPPRNVPMEILRIPLAARHYADLTGIRSWAEHCGRSLCDDGILLALDLMTPEILENGHLLVSRPDVVRIMRRCHQLVAAQCVEVPLDMVSIVAAILEFNDSEGTLVSGSDPLDALLEPLHAHFGLSLSVDGEHRCECFAAYSPDRGDDERLLPLRTGHVLAVKLAEDPPDAFDPQQPLRLFSSRLAKLWGGREPVDLSDISLLGWIPATDQHHRFWVHGRAGDPGRWDSLPLDDFGRAHIPVLDRRYRCGYRWDQTSALDARWLCRLGDHIPPSLPITWRL